MQVLRPIVVDAVAESGLPRADIDAVWHTGKSTDEVLNEHLGSVRNALMKREYSSMRSGGSMLRPNRSRTELLADTVRDRPRAPSAQSFLFLSNAIRNPDKVEQVKQEQRRSTSQFVESATNLALLTNSASNTQRDLSNVVEKLQLNTAATEFAASLPHQADADGSFVDYHALYEPFAAQFDDVAIKSDRAAPFLHTNKIREHKATYSKCKTLVGRLRHPQNRTLPSEYDQLFGGTRKKLVADGRHSVGDFKRAASGHSSIARDYPEEPADAEVLAAERSASKASEARGTYFVLSNGGQPERRAIPSATRVQVGRNGQPVYGDENLSNMLGDSPLLKKDRATLIGALDALKLEDDHFLGPQRLSWKEELADPAGRIFDLQVLDQRKAALRAKEETEPTRHASETPRRNIPLDLDRAWHVIEKNPRLAFPLTRVDTLPKSNASIPTSTYVPIPPGARPPPVEPRPAVSARKPPDDAPLDKTHRIRVRSPARPPPRRPQAKAHRVRQPLFVTRPPPALKLSVEQWRNYVLHPGPSAEVPLDALQKRTVDFSRPPPASASARLRKVPAASPRLNVVHLGLAQQSQRRPPDDDVPYQPAPLGATSRSAVSRATPRPSAGFRTLSAHEAALSPSHFVPRERSAHSVSGLHGFAIAAPFANSAHSRAHSAGNQPPKTAFVTQNTQLPQPVANALSDLHSVSQFSEPRVSSASQPVVIPNSGHDILVSDARLQNATAPNAADSGDVATSYTPAPPGSVRSDDDADNLSGELRFSQTAAADLQDFRNRLHTFNPPELEPEPELESESEQSLQDAPYVQEQESEVLQSPPDDQLQAVQETVQQVEDRREIHNLQESPRMHAHQQSQSQSPAYSQVHETVDLQLQQEPQEVHQQPVPQTQPEMHGLQDSQDQAPSESSESDLPHQHDEQLEQAAEISTPLPDELSDVVHIDLSIPVVDTTEEETPHPGEDTTDQ